MGKEKELEEEKCKQVSGGINIPTSDPLPKDPEPCTKKCKICGTVYPYHSPYAVCRICGESVWDYS